MTSEEIKEEKKIKALEKYIKMHEDDHPEILAMIAKRLEVVCREHGIPAHTSHRRPRLTDESQTSGMDDEPQTPKSGNLVMMQIQRIKDRIKAKIESQNAGVEAGFEAVGVNGTGLMFK